jgi:hypothetical protein
MITLFMSMVVPSISSRNASIFCMKIDISKIFDSCIGGFSFRFLAHTGSFCGGRTGFSLLFPGYEHIKSMRCSLSNPNYMLLPPIENNCRQFCTGLVQNLYWVRDSYFRSEGFPLARCCCCWFIDWKCIFIDISSTSSKTWTCIMFTCTTSIETWESVETHMHPTSHNKKA